MHLIQTTRHPNTNGGQDSPAQPEVTITNVNATYDADVVTVVYNITNATSVTSVVVEDADGTLFNATSPTLVGASIDVTGATSGTATVTITVGDKSETTTVEIN